jgi:hypothetical protein
MDMAAGQPPGVVLPVAEINLMMPPCFLVAAVVTGGLAVEVGAEETVVFAGVAAWVVEEGVVEVEEEQPERMKAQTNSSTRGMKTFFTISLLQIYFSFSEIIRHLDVSLFDSFPVS